MATHDEPVEQGGFRLPNWQSRPIEAWWMVGHPTFTGVYISPPDYLRDLNAVHEAEKVLTPKQEGLYVRLLSEKIMEEAYEDEERYQKSHLSSADQIYRCSSKQRLESLVRALGKWTK
jgi:hypothetical protein